MSAVVTSELRRFQSNNLKAALNQYSKNKVYVCIGKTSVWLDENDPDTAVDSVVNRADFYDDMVAGKAVSESNCYVVTKRVDWVSGTVYDVYSDVDDMFDTSSKLHPGSRPLFYVVTDTLDVYKCLDNNNNSPSTDKPAGTSTAAFETSDGYRWKYMYTITTQQQINFMTADWMPIQSLLKIDGSAQWMVQENAVDGAIESYRVVDGGSGYSSSNPPTVTVTGNGVNASAEVEIDDQTGKITSVKPSTIGSGYTQVTVTIDGGAGSGAVVEGVLPPPGGHGKDAVSELGGVNLMVTARFVDDETGQISTDISYRKIGLLVNPLSREDGQLFVLSNLTGNFEDGEPIDGLSSGATGTIIKHDILEGVAYVRVVTGAFQTAEQITGGNSAVTATIDSQRPEKLPAVSEIIQRTDIEDGTGELLYLENRVAVDRLPGQVEFLSFVLA